MKNLTQNYYLVYIKSEADSVGAGNKIPISLWVCAKLTVDATSWIPKNFSHYQFSGLVNQLYIVWVTRGTWNIYENTWKTLCILYYMLVKFSSFTTAINPKESGNEIVSSHF